MNYLLAANTDSPAYALGYLLGMLFVIVVFIGIIVFGIIAIIKAFTRRTTGWIVAGSISGLVFAIPVLLIFAGVFAGIMSAHRQSSTAASTPRPTEGAYRAAASPPLATPSTAQTLRGGDLSYTITLPDGWTFKRKTQDFDILASHGSLYVGVIAEEASLGTPETIAKIARDKLKEMATDLRWSEPSTLLVDGRLWLQFVAQCKVEDIPITYQFYVYSGSEGTFQVVGFTTQNLYSRDSGPMRDVMRTFKFPR